MKLIQINVCANWGSTGRIAENIGKKALEAGWDSYIYYGDFCNPSASHLIKAVGRFPFMYEHYFECRFLDREGLASRIPTMRLIKLLKRINPDIIHLHNIHDHWVNYPILFRFLKKANIPVVWTFHDIWPITGHCYIDYGECEKWKTGCYSCPKGNKYGIDRSRANYKLKKQLFSQIDNLTIVPVSNWLGSLVEKSFLGEKTIRVINNGVDTSVFKPIQSTISEKYQFKGKVVLLAVATVWNSDKGLYDYIRLSQILSEQYQLVLVGLTKQQIDKLPPKIKGIERTDSQSELVFLYNIASIVLSLSYSETFGLSIVEGMACGTPVIVYDNTAQKDIVTLDTGIVVETGNVQSVNDAVENIVNKGKAYYEPYCRERACKYYDMNSQYSKYISLYYNLLEK